MSEDFVECPMGKICKRVMNHDGEKKAAKCGWWWIWEWCKYLPEELKKELVELEEEIDDETI